MVSCSPTLSTVCLVSYLKGPKATINNYYWVVRWTFPFRLHMWVHVFRMKKQTVQDYFGTCHLGLHWTLYSLSWSQSPRIHRKAGQNWLETDFSSRRHVAPRHVPSSFVIFNINLFTLTQIALFFFFSKWTHSQQWTTYWLTSSLYTVNWLKEGETKRIKEETSNLILPPLYYGMHRFQTLLRKRQQTLCLRSFLNDAVTACDPRKKKKRNEPRYRKARFHREKKSQLRTPGKKLEEKMDVVSSESLSIPVSLQVASTNTQASNTQLRCLLPKVFGSLFCKCGSHSAVDNTECFWCLFLFRFPRRCFEH